MNNCTFTVNLARDAEFRQVGGGSVLNFVGAATAGFGEKKQTLWLDCALWGKRGESLQQYMTKGQQLVICGELGQREYQKDGETRTALTMRVAEVTLVGGKKEQAPQQQWQQQAPQQQQYTAPPQQQSQQGQPPMDFDDDIPFAPIGLQYRALLSCI